LHELFKETRYNVHLAAMREQLLQAKW